MRFWYIYPKARGNKMSEKSSKIVKAAGFLALVAVVVAVGRLIFKGIRKAKENVEPEEQDQGV